MWHRRHGELPGVVTLWEAAQAFDVEIDCPGFHVLISGEPTRGQCGRFARIDTTAAPMASKVTFGPG